MVLSVRVVRIAASGYRLNSHSVSEDVDRAHPTQDVLGAFEAGKYGSNCW